MKIPRELYPFESHFLDLEGLRYHYLDEGPEATEDAEVIVLLHGNPSWSFYYRNLVRGLRERYRCIVPDHIGCGLSDKPDDAAYDYVLARRVEDLDRLLAHLGVKQNLTLIAHDWGGMIGMTWASHHPEAVRRFVLLNTAAFPLPESRPFPWELKLTRSPLGTVLVRGLNAFARGAASRGVTRKPMAPEVRRAFLAPYNSWKNRIATLRFVQEIPLRASDRGFALIKETEAGLAQFRDRPALICWGERDFIFDASFLACWERHWPHARVRRFPECGHYVLEDAPDEILAEVRTFLDAHPLPESA